MEQYRSKNNKFVIRKLTNQYVKFIYLKFNLSTTKLNINKYFVPIREFVYILML